MSYTTSSNSLGNPRAPRAESTARTRCGLRLPAPRPGDAAAAFLGEHSTQSAVALFCRCGPSCLSGLRLWTSSISVGSASRTSIGISSCVHAVAPS